MRKSASYLLIGASLISLVFLLSSGSALGQGSSANFTASVGSATSEVAMSGSSTRAPGITTGTNTQLNVILELSGIPDSDYVCSGMWTAAYPNPPGDAASSIPPMTCVQNPNDNSSLSFPLSPGTNYDIRVTISTCDGNCHYLSATVRVEVPPTTIGVRESGAPVGSSGSWSVSPTGCTASTCQVYPDTNGTLHTLTVNSAPAGYRVLSITNSDGGGSSMTVFPGNDSSTTYFTINYERLIPNVNIQANSSEGPVSISLGQSVTLSWTSQNVDSCSASTSPSNSNWTGSKAISGSQSSGALNTAGTHRFTIDCTNSGNGLSATDFVDVSVTSQPPPVTVDLDGRTAGSGSYGDGPITISSGGNIDLTWTSSGATSCTASGGWSGAKATSGIQTGVGPVNVNPTTFTLTCSDSSGNSNPDSFVVNLSFPPPPPPEPPSSVTANTSSQCGGGIVVSWTTSSGATSYKLFRNSVLLAPGLTTTSYTDTGLTPGATYTYYVVASNSAGDSLPSNSVSATASAQCITTAPVLSASTSSTCGGRIELSWTPVSGAASYNIIRGGVFFVNTVNTTFSDGGLTPGVTYSYQVGGVNPQSSGPLSNTASAAASAACSALTADLQAALDGANWQNSLSGTAPLNGVDLKADAGGGTGTINYTFYCNRADSGTNVTSPWDAKFNGVSNLTQTVADLCGYSAAGSYTAKIIVERGSDVREDRVNISISGANSPPSASGLNSTPGNQCVSPLQPTLAWTYSDPDGDPQSSYQLQISDESDFDDLESDTGQVNSSSNSYAVPPGVLEFNKTYYWRVKVWDSIGNVSSWANGPSLTTQPHAAPNPDFIWSPSNPQVNENVQFTDQTVFSGGASGSNWSWVFPDGNPSANSARNPNVKFTSAGQKAVSLTVTDTDNLTCSATKNVGVTTAIPQFKEIIP